MSRFEKIKDKCADCWETMGDFFKAKPITVILLFLVMIGSTVALTYSTVSSSQNSSDINEVKAQFCNPPRTATHVDKEMNKKRCQQLLDQLLKNPTSKQRKRIQDIAGGGS